MGSGSQAMDTGPTSNRIKNIRLTSDDEEIECNSEKVKGLVLKTCFLKKV
jgi:uncharacterized Zn ribbon protein